MTEILDYEPLVATFEDGLINKLRGHGAGRDYLELWVPDDNPVESLINMVEAASSSGVDVLKVRIMTSTLPTERLVELEQELDGIAALESELSGNGYILTFSITG